MLAEAQETAGARLLKPAADAAWGGYAGYFADPDGFPWEVAWNQPFRMNADGSIRIRLTSGVRRDVAAPVKRIPSRAAYGPRPSESAGVR